MYKDITKEAQTAVLELIEAASLTRGDLLVIGCSTSEVGGEHIGKGSSLEIAHALHDGIAPILADRGIYLAAQCCEHLNRAVILEAEAAAKCNIAEELESELQALSADKETAND